MLKLGRHYGSIFHQVVIDGRKEGGGGGVREIEREIRFGNLENGKCSRDSQKMLEIINQKAAALENFLHPIAFCGM